MSVFMKSCFSCGKKTNELFSGKCEECFTEEMPPVKEVKPLNVKFCNMCGKVHFGNTLYDVEEFEEMLPSIMEKRVVLNEGYKLNRVEIVDFVVEGNKLEFDLDVDADIA